MTGAPLDERSTFRVDPTLTVAVGPDGTPVAVGGSPMRLLRLRPPADAVLAQLRAGATLGEVLESLAPQRRAAASRFVATLVQRGIVHAIPTPNGTRRFDDVTIVVPVRDRAEPLRRLLGIALARAGFNVLEAAGELDVQRYLTGKSIGQSC